MMWMAQLFWCVGQVGCSQNAALQMAYGGAVNPVTLGRSAVLQGWHLALIKGMPRLQELLLGR